MRTRNPMATRVIMMTVLAVVSTGCAGRDYQPVVDRPGPNYAKDLAECQALTDQRSVAKEAAVDSVVGATVMAALFAAVAAAGGGDAGSGAAIGAGLGGIGGGLLGASSQRSNSREIVKKCLTHRGYAVVGD